MGLDISAYKNVKRVTLTADQIDEDGYPEDWSSNVDFVHESTLNMHESYWPGRTEGLEPGYYEAEESFGFRAGSYGGYSQWREWLAEIAGYEGGPFHELINFSDCEGIIGPVVSKKLAKDFADFADKVGTEGYNAERYHDWRKAFEMAADNGYVDFH